MFDSSQFLSLCPADLRKNVAISRPLKGMTTLEVGGPAAVVCSVVNPEQARRFQDICNKLHTPSYILGAGSNILADDAGYPGVILHVATREIILQSDTLTVGAGLDFDQVIVESLNHGLTGLEFASGIPGTLGGALVGNAGCYGHEIGEFLVEAVVLRRDGQVETVGPDAFGFHYRSTLLRESGDLILSATLRLKRGDLNRAQSLRNEKIEDRKSKHPVNLPSAGSWFKNLPAPAAGARRQAAGQLLEQAGAKDMSEGDAKVFAKHANMIVNSGQATSAQIQKLATRMAQAVEDKFGIVLEPEVRYLDPRQQQK